MQPVQLYPLDDGAMRWRADYRYEVTNLVLQCEAFLGYKVKQALLGRFKP